MFKQTIPVADATDSPPFPRMYSALVVIGILPALLLLVYLPYPLLNRYTSVKDLVYTLMLSFLELWLVAGIVGWFRRSARSYTLLAITAMNLALSCIPHYIFPATGSWLAELVIPVFYTLVVLIALGVAAAILASKKSIAHARQNGGFLFPRKLIATYLFTLALYSAYGIYKLMTSDLPFK